MSVRQNHSVRHWQIVEGAGIARDNLFRSLAGFGRAVFGNVLIERHQWRAYAVTPDNEFLNYNTVHVVWVFEEIYSRRDSRSVLLVTVVVLTAPKKYAIGA